MISIQLNGECREFAEGSTLLTLLDSLSLRPQQVAIELNRSVVPRAQYAETTLSAEDKVEVVTFVGGG